MKLQDFRQSLSDAEPPKGLSQPLLALWYAGKDDWHRAHELVQKDPGPQGAWVHAHLHRVEGDAANADYWYRRADRTPPQGGTSEELWDIARELLESA